MTVAFVERATHRTGWGKKRGRPPLTTEGRPVPEPAPWGQQRAPGTRKRSHCCKDSHDAVQIPVATRFLFDPCAARRGVRKTASRGQPACGGGHTRSLGREQLADLLPSRRDLLPSRSAGTGRFTRSWPEVALRAEDRRDHALVLDEKILGGLRDGGVDDRIAGEGAVEVVEHDLDAEI